MQNVVWLRGSENGKMTSMQNNDLMTTEHETKSYRHLCNLNVSFYIFQSVLLFFSSTLSTLFGLFH